MGFEFWVNSIEITGLAAKIRLFLKSAAVKQWTDKIHNMSDDDDAFHVYPRKAWLSSSCCTSIASIIAKINDLPPNIVVSTTHLQAAISRWLLQQAEDPVADTLRRRLLPVIHYEFPNITEWLSGIACSLKSVPGFAQVGFCRSLFNAWNTKARYGHKDRCKWCGLVESDDLRHYLVCSTMLTLLEKFAPQVYEVWVDYPSPPMKPWVTRAAFGFELSESLVVQVIVVHDLLHSAYSNFKHEGMLDLQACFVARARALCRHSAMLQECITRNFHLLT